MMLFIALFLPLLLVKTQDLIVNTTILFSAVGQGAVCLDGSPPVYMFDRGTAFGVNNWIVQIEGGGWCSTISECVLKMGTGHGSSKYMLNKGHFKGILSNKPSENPDFHNWNRVKVKYCDGSSFTGDIDEVNPDNNLHFRGARIFDAIMGELLSKGMINAENAILSGSSAGGLAATLNCDKFRNFLPQSVKVKCVSDAGFFINVNTILNKPHIQEYYKGVVTLHGSVKNLPTSCTSHVEPTLCFFPEHAIQHTRTPLFIINSAYDSWQVNNSLVPVEADPHNYWMYCKHDINKCSPSQIQTLQDFRLAFINALTNAIRATSPNGYLITSCHSHNGIERQSYWLYNNSPKVADKTIAEAVGKWFLDGDRFQEILCPYPCGLFCQSK